MKVSELYKIFLDYPVISIDSRTIPENSIFFALQGNNFNGNKFASEALKKGATYSIIDEKEYCTNEKTILVDNVLETLQNLSNHHRRELNIPIIAITGTNGKTTTKELIYAILSKKYKVVATKGNLNNHIGAPLTILSFRQDTELGIVEMGANHRGEIKKLCYIAEPQYGIITNIGKAHLDGFKSLQGIIKTKYELFDYLIAQNGTAFVNNNDKHIIKMNLPKKSIHFGARERTNCWGKILDSNTYLNIEIAFYKEKTKPLIINTQLVGNYNLDNLLASVCISTYFNVSGTHIKEALENYVPNNNRSQIIKTKNNTVILDAYNANPTSVEAVIKSFIQINEKNKIIILGDMLELGAESITEHKKIIEIVTNFNINCFYIGENYKKALNNKENSFSTIDQFCQWEKKNKIKNSTIMLKGSRKLKLETLIHSL